MFSPKSGVQRLAEDPDRAIELDNQTLKSMQTNDTAVEPSPVTVAEGSSLIFHHVHVQEKLRPSMYDLESGSDKDIVALPKYDESIQLINCDCEYMLDSVHLCPNYTLFAIVFSSLMIIFFVMLREAGLGNKLFSVAMIPLYIAIVLLALVLTALTNPKYLHADEGLSKTNFLLWFLGKFGALLSGYAVLAGAIVTLALVSSKLDGNMPSAAYLSLIIPSLAGLVVALAISALCLNSKVIFFSIGVYQNSALIALSFIDVLAFLFIVNLVLIGLRADRTINVSWYVVFIPLILFFGICCLWSIVTTLKECLVQEELSVTTSTTHRRLVDCCSLFAYVTPELATSFPLLLFSFNVLVVIFLICAAAESSISTISLMLFNLVLPVSWIFLMTCASCTLFVSHNPYPYNFD